MVGRRCGLLQVLRWAGWASRSNKGFLLHILAWPYITYDCIRSEFGHVTAMTGMFVFGTGAVWMLGFTWELLLSYVFLTMFACYGLALAAELRKVR